MCRLYTLCCYGNEDDPLIGDDIGVRAPLTISMASLVNICWGADKGQSQRRSSKFTTGIKIYWRFFLKWNTKFQSYFGCFRQEGQVTCHRCNPASRPVIVEAPAQVHNQSTYLLHLSERINRGEVAGWKWGHLSIMTMTFWLKRRELQSNKQATWHEVDTENRW